MLTIVFLTAFMLQFIFFVHVKKLHAVDDYAVRFRAWIKHHREHTFLTGIWISYPQLIHFDGTLRKSLMMGEIDESLPKDLFEIGERSAKFCEKLKNLFKVYAIQWAIIGGFAFVVSASCVLFHSVERDNLVEQCVCSGAGVAGCTVILWVIQRHLKSEIDHLNRSLELFVRQRTSLQCNDTEYRKLLHQESTLGIDLTAEKLNYLNLRMQKTLWNCDERLERCRDLFSVLTLVYYSLIAVTFFLLPLLEYISTYDGVT